MEEHSESDETGRNEKGKSESYANEARVCHGETWISAATTLPVNITMTRRQSRVISLTQIGRCRTSSACEGQS